MPVRLTNPVCTPKAGTRNMTAISPERERSKTSLAEQVKDPAGNLQRNITRVYDGLNRVQQVTGASN
jgi:hypothetical protein